MKSNREPEHVVVIGAGFAGIEVIKHLKKTNLKITLIDKQNYHQFTPLLYQVATAQLEIEEIVFPIRQLFQNRNVEFLMAEVNSIDPDLKIVYTSEKEVRYHKLVIATGSITNYFGVSDAAEITFPLKTLQDGLYLRNHLLRLVEVAKNKDLETRKECFNFVIVGGGPTGVEFAEALAELLNGPMKEDHPEIDREEFSVHLIDANSRILKDYDPKLSKYTEKKLMKLGVTIHKGTYVTDVSSTRAYLSTGNEILTRTIVWSAGVSGPKYLTDWNLSLTVKNFIEVNEYLQVLNYPSIYAIGDISEIQDYPLPKMATVAQQQGRYVAKHIKLSLKSKVSSAFKYKTIAKMAVIGRNAAIVESKHIKFSGFFAWLTWSLIHIYKLIGTRNRLNIMINWVIAYIRHGGQSRIILPEGQTRRKAIEILA